MSKHLSVKRMVGIAALVLFLHIVWQGTAPAIAQENPAQANASTTVRTFIPFIQGGSGNSDPVPPSVTGTTFYVATTGNDSNPGTATQPWRTIQKAANTLVAGQAVIVGAGTYNETVVESSSGTSGSLISYVANGTVTINGFNVQGNYIQVQGFTVTPTDCGSWLGAINVSGSYNLIQNNTVQNSTRQGIVTLASASSNTISGNTVTRANVNGMHILGNNQLIENNNISHTADHQGTCVLTGDANGIEFHGSGHIFRGNFIHDFFKSDQSGQPHIDAFQTFSDLGNSKPAGKNIVFERNHVFMGNSATGVLELPWSSTSTIYAFMVGGTSGDQADNITIRNNIFESWGGFNVGGGLNVSNLKIYNNTWRSISNSSYGPFGIHINAVSTYQVYNNITVDFSYAHIGVDASTGGQWGYNLMWNSNGTTPGLPGYTVQPSDKRGVNPIFVSNFGNLHLQSSSPAIDTGLAISGLTNDYDGGVRPQGAGYDRGADEYANTASATAVPTNAPAPATTVPTATQTATAVPTATRTSTPTPTSTTGSVATATPVAPTATKVPPTATSVAPTATLAPSGTTLTFNSAADAYVNSTYPSTNYGSSSQIRVDGSPYVNSYIRFNVQGITTGVSKAVLRIYANSALTSGYAVHAESNNSWTESTITYSNAPAIGSAIASTSAISAYTWVSIDVTPYITGNGTFSFVLTDPSATAVSLASRESANVPQLSITTK